MKAVKSLLLVVVLLFSSFAIHAQEVDINHATAKMLAKHLNGVGIKKANAIVLYRKKHGSFKKIDDLAKVKGIGKKTLAANRKNIILGKRKVKK